MIWPTAARARFVVNSLSMVAHRSASVMIRPCLMLISQAMFARRGDDDPDFRSDALVDVLIARADLLA